MIRKVFPIVLILLLVAYLGMAVTAFNRKPARQVCRDVMLVIKDSAHNRFVTQAELKSILTRKKLYPVDKEMTQISTKAIERELQKHPLVDRVECYKTPNGKICVEMAQRIPVIRIMSANGESYYIDNKGQVMPASAKCNAHLAVATGEIEKSFAARELYRIGLFLQNHAFWSAQIEQIHVLPGENIEFVPRVGDHIVYLGKSAHFEKKLERLKTFYEKVLNQVGWNKYSRINMEFGNQIVCTKRDEFVSE